MLTSFRPRVALLCSRRCPGISSLLRAHRRRRLEIALCLATDEAFTDRERLEAAEIPVLSHPIRPFYADRRAPRTDLPVRRDYDRRTAEILDSYHPDLLLLSSYLYRLTEPVLDAYPRRIVNVHGSDMARMGPDGRPLYPGLFAVREAILAGEPETRASAHIVTEQLDDGPLLLRSRAFPVSPLVADLRHDGHKHAIHAYAYAHQEWMLATAWGPLLTESVALLAARGGSPEVSAYSLPAAEPAAHAAGARP
jgi:folate-dependent phosphoribosylglycinamide formyltransferase PurN